MLLSLGVVLFTLLLVITVVAILESLEYAAILASPLFSGHIFLTAICLSLGYDPHDVDQTLAIAALWLGILLTLYIRSLPPLVPETEAMARARRPWEFVG